MYRRFIIPLLLTSCLCCFFTAYAETDHYYTVKELNNDWKVYDKNFHKYIPLVTQTSTIHNGGIYLNNRDDQEYYISFYSNEGLSLFEDNKLIYKHPSGNINKPQRVRISIDRIYQYAEEEPFLLIFQNNQFGVYTDSVCIQVKLPFQIQGIQSDQQNATQIKVRSGFFDRENFLITFLCFIGLLVFYKYIFMKGRTLINVGLDRNMELLLMDRSGAMSVLLIIINSILFMMLFYLMGKDQMVHFNIPFRTILNYDNNTSFAFYILLIFAIMQTLKIVYVKIINALTFSSGVSSLQNYLLLNYLFQTGLLLLPILLVISLLPLHYMIFMAEIAPQIFFIILVIISLLTSYMIYSRSELRNIYLFSYICTAEIVPLAIAFRVLIS